MKGQLATRLNRPHNDGEVVELRAGKTHTIASRYVGVLQSCLGCKCKITHTRNFRCSTVTLLAWSIPKTIWVRWWVDNEEIEAFNNSHDSDKGMRKHQDCQNGFPRTHTDLTKSSDGFGQKWVRDMTAPRAHLFDYTGLWRPFDITRGTSRPTRVTWP